MTCYPPDEGTKLGNGKGGDGKQACMAVTRAVGHCLLCPFAWRRWRKQRSGGRHGVSLELRHGGKAVLA